MVRYTPECPFCGRIIKQPVEVKTEFGSVHGGTCDCGAVYVCDLTGHNTGEAYMEALALAQGNWQLGDMGENVDYETSDMHYDMNSHQRVFSKGLGSPAGELVFVKMKSIQPEEGRPDRKEKQTATRRDSSHTGKDRLKALLEGRAFDEAANMAMQDKGVIRWLISLTYDKQDVIGWRAIEAIGVVSRAFAKDSIERLGIMRDTIRRLLWSMGEESGGIGWSSAEILGEIVASDVDAFNDIIPILWSFRDEDNFRAGIIWAMGRIAMTRPELVGFIMQDLPGMLADKNPAVRGYTIWVLCILDSACINSDRISGLSGDKGPVPFYSNGDLLAKTVGEMAGEALHKSAK